MPTSTATSTPFTSTAYNNDIKSILRFILIVSLPFGFSGQYGYFPGEHPDGLFGTSEDRSDVCSFCNYIATPTFDIPLVIPASLRILRSVISLYYNGRLFNNHRNDIIEIRAFRDHGSLSDLLQIVVSPLPSASFQSSFDRSFNRRYNCEFPSPSGHRFPSSVYGTFLWAFPHHRGTSQRSFDISPPRPTLNPYSDYLFGSPKPHIHSRLLDYDYDFLLCEPALTRKSLYDHPRLRIFFRLLRSFHSAMRLQLTDWNYVEAIEFSFIEADKTATQNYLNAAYANKLTDLISLISYKYGTATLRPGAIPNIKSLVAESITRNLPESEVSAKCKEHIQQLLDKTNIWYVDNHGMRQLVHDDQVLAISANEARYNSEWNSNPTIRLELSIQHWGFRSGWFPYKFTKVYDKNGGATAFETSKSLEPMPTAVRIISRENEFCFDLPDPYFEYITFKQIYRMTFPPSYAWTWTYSPNSDSVSFHRVRSTSFQHFTSSSSCRVRCQQDKSHVTASYKTPSTMPNLDHHSTPPSAHTNFRWTFNPQNEIATFRRVPKSVPSPPSETLAEDADQPHAAPAYIRSLQPPCHNQSPSKPNHPPVLRLSKRHWDALKVKQYHLYANILSMNWFYDTFD
eukprot:jgi/Psemu1/34328/gm1.34328_g